MTEHATESVAPKHAHTWTRGVCYGCGPRKGERKVTRKGAYMLCAYHYESSDAALQLAVRARSRTVPPMWAGPNGEGWERPR